MYQPDYRANVEGIPERVIALVAAVLTILLVGVLSGAADVQPPPPPVRDLQEEGDEGQADSLVDILTAIAEDRELSIFLGLLRESGMDSVLAGEGQYTVFVPVDSAFESPGQVQLDSLKAHGEELRSLLARHIVPDRRLIFVSTGKIRVTTLDGEEIAILVDEELVSVRKANVIDEGLECSNGVVHVVDAVLMPKKQKGKQ